MKKLTKKDFTMYVGDIYYFHRFDKKEREYEICFEPCLNGFCVGLYEYLPDFRVPSLVVPKKCTNQNGYMGDLFAMALGGYRERREETWDLALKLANEMLKVYFKK